MNVKDLIGKKCLIRTRDAGVHFGRLDQYSYREVLLTHAYRVYSWEGACSLSQLAAEGSKYPKKCRITVPVTAILLTEVIEVIEMSDKAIGNLTEFSWKID